MEGKGRGVMRDGRKRTHDLGFTWEKQPSETGKRATDWVLGNREPHKRALKERGMKEEMCGMDDVNARGNQMRGEVVR